MNEQINNGGHSQQAARVDEGMVDAACAAFYKDAGWQQNINGSRDALRAALEAALSAQPAERQGEADAVLIGLKSGVSECIENGDGRWETCTGCYETEDGHPVGRYYYSEALRCDLGAGCSECGGLGAIWDTTDYEAMARELSHDDRSHPAAPVGVPDRWLETVADAAGSLDKRGDRQMALRLMWLHGQMLAAAPSAREVQA